MPTTVILGAGIIGLSSAHALAALAPPDHHIHLVDPAPRLFASASGKAAGFLAKDWFAPATNPLGALSFDLHRDLARHHDGFRRWGYSQSVSYSLDHAYDSDDARSESDSSRSDKNNLNAPSNSPPQAEGTTAPAPLTAANSAAATGTAAASSPSQSDLSLGPTETPSRAPEEQAATASSPVPDWLLSGGSRRSSVDSAHANSHAAAAGRGAGPSADALPAWLHAPPAALEALSDATSTAQVHPLRLCEFLLEECLAAGVTLHHPARATRVVRDDVDPPGVARVRVEYIAPQGGGPETPSRTVDIACESIVIAAGCWTPQVYATLFPNASRMPRITHLAGYSITLKSKQWAPPSADGGVQEVDDDDLTPGREEHPPLAPLGASSSVAPAPAPQEGSPHASAAPCHAIFTDAAGFAPELFSRATGEIWVGGLNPPLTSLPALPTDADAQIDAGEVARLLSVARALCGADAEQRGKPALCFRPVSATGRPIIARVHEADLGDGAKPGLGGLSGGGVRGGGGGVFVAAGHGPWGISLSLGTGRVVAEMVLGRETSVDVEVLTRWDGVVDYCTRPMTP